MRSRIRLVCLIVTVVLLSGGCAPKGELIHQGKVYNIRCIDNWYYIHLYEGYHVRNIIDVPTTKVEFDNVAQMKEGILAGDFTYAEVKEITDYSISNAEARICNPYQLYEPYTPAALYKRGLIDFRGWCYIFPYTVRGIDECKISIILPEIYSDRIEGFADYEDVKKRKHALIQWEGTDPETGAQCLRVSEGGVNWYYVREVYETSEKKLHICYLYRLESGMTQLESVTVYGEENGGYFQADLSGFQIKVDTAFLSQFGITPFEGNEPPPAAIG